jgi:hypothetical protein
MVIIGLSIGRKKNKQQKNLPVSGCGMRLWWK